MAGEIIPEEVSQDNEEVQEVQDQAQNEAIAPCSVFVPKNSVEYLMEEYGSLKYPGVCPNHHLADRYPKWVQYYRKRKREMLNRRVNKRWGERPMILRDPTGPVISNVFTVGSDADLLINHILPKLVEDDHKANATLVCKGWAREVRVVHPPTCDRLIMKRLLVRCGTHYHVKVIRGPKGEVHVLRYWCACEQWDNSIAYRNVVDWSLMNPIEDEDYEDYLTDPIMKKALATLHDDPRY